MGRSMLKAYRIAAVAIVFAALVVGIPGAAFAQSKKPDTSKRVDLVLYLLGDKPADTDAVYQEISKLALKDINATLRVEFLSWGDWMQKYSLVLASGEQVDLIYTSLWAKYSDEATKGAFREVTPDILQKYMPLTWKSQDKISFDQALLDGKSYFVPKNESSFSGYYLAVIRGDLREKYGLPKPKSLADYEKYLDAVAKNEKGIFPVNTAVNNVELRILMFEQGNSYFEVGDGYNYVTSDPNLRSADQIKLKYNTPEYLAHIKKMREWVAKGYWSKSAISNKTHLRDAFENGTSASMIWNLPTCCTTYTKLMKEHPEWKPEVYDLTPDKPHQLGLYINDGYAVAAASKNPERAFMMLDLLKNDPRYYNLAVYGIQGKHWEPVGDDMWKPGPDQEKFPAGAACSWGLNNRLLHRDKFGGDQLEKQYTQKWMPIVVHPSVEGFQFNDANVKTEAAALTAVWNKYGNILEFGLIDAEEGIKQLVDNMYKAGFAKFDKEYKAQLDKFLADKAKKK
jgi:putative aldouronate transport system substrate-binding protein